MSVLNDMIRRTIADNAERTALVDANERWTFAALGERANRAGRAITSSGVSPGDRLALFLRNCNSWMAVELGCHLSGICTIPANQRFNPEELVWVLDNSEATAIVFSPAELATIEKIHDLRPDLLWLCVDSRGLGVPDWAIDLDEAIGAVDGSPIVDSVSDDALARIMYTSATTGLPKGVVIDHDHWRMNKLHLLLNVFDGVDSSDCYLAATPLTHMAGGWTWLTLLRGGKTVILEKWDAKTFADVCKSEGVSLLMMAPTLFVGLLQHLDQTPSDMDTVKSLTFKRIMYGASPMPQPVSVRIEEVFGPIMRQLYGFTENIGNGLGMTVTSLASEWHQQKRTSCGRPQMNTAIRVVDDDGNDVPLGEKGEVVTRAWRPRGIWKNPEATAEIVRDGWIHSGDIGVFDSDGFLTLVDRKNYMIVSGGLNVYPMEIENAMYEFNGIEECAVIGAPHEYWVETPVAYYTVSEGAVVNPDDLREFLRDRLAHYKVPTEFTELPELPKSSYGKILKRELKALQAPSQTTVA